MKIAVSACLLGENVRYDGSNRFNEELNKLLKKHEIIRICPETMAGLPVPRCPIEIREDRIVDAQGQDYTDELSEACRECLKRIGECDFIILKSKSPSCGYKEIYDGTFSGKMKEGNGLFAAMCLENGYKIYTENDLETLKEILD